MHEYTQPEEQSLYQKLIKTKGFTANHIQLNATKAERKRRAKRTSTQEEKMRFIEFTKEKSSGNSSELPDYVVDSPFYDEANPP